MAKRSQVTITWAGIDGAQPLDVTYLEDGPAGGPLALCLHGFPDHAPTWEGLMADLAAAGFHAVAPWMRGYAPTAVPADGLYQTAALSLDAVALADALAPAGHPAVLIGHDWGALATYGAAVHRPDRFQRLVAMAVPHGASLGMRLFTHPPQLKKSWYIFFFQLPLAEMGVAHNDFAVIDKLWRDWSPGYEPPDGYFAALKETLGAPGGLEAALGYYRALINPLKQDERLAAVQANATAFVPVPTLYLHGEDDGCIGPDMVDAEILEQVFPAGLELEMLPGLGHFLHLENPALVSRRILEFLTAES